MPTDPEGINGVPLEKLVLGGSSSGGAKVQESQVDERTEDFIKPLAVFFGGNFGTCESLAQTVAHSSPSHGFRAEIQPLDNAAYALPKDRPVLIITSTYEGGPPDNAGQFLKWIEGIDGKSLAGVQYAVFGCGNRKNPELMNTHRHIYQTLGDWKDKFQHTAKFIDAAMERGGARNFATQGIADVADNDVFNDFENWEDAVFWSAISEGFDGSKKKVFDGEALKLEIATSLRSSHIRQDVKDAVIVRNELLSVGQDAPKRHIEIRLPADAFYRAGDYLAVLPMNPLVTVHRVVKHFRLPRDATITVDSEQTSLTRGTPLLVYDLLCSYVELSQPATRRVSLFRGCSMLLWTLLKCLLHRT